MFSEIDKTIFPDRCEVLEIVPSQHYVFPIFKCGSSSLELTAQEQGWKTIVNNNIAEIEEITVFLRDPQERFFSGVNTYVQQCLRDNPDLDQHTILFFVREYLFLNRHYAPQMFWLLNLARYSNATLNLQPLKNIDTLTKKHSRAGIDEPNNEIKTFLQGFPRDKLELYFFLDQLLIDRIGQRVSLQNILKEFKHQQPELYDLVFGRLRQFINVLPKT